MGNKVYIGNCIDSFDEDGVCTNSSLPWADVVQFAQAVEECDSIVVGSVSVEYCAEKDIHSFYKHM